MFFTSCIVMVLAPVRIAPWLRTSCQVALATVMTSIPVFEKALILGVQQGVDKVLGNLFEGNRRKSLAEFLNELVVGRKNA